jgi:hypothetical protein
MKVEIVNPVEYPKWDSLILSHPGYSFFHSSAWARVLHEAYGYKPLYFTVFDGDAIAACLPIMEVNSFITGKRSVSLPFSDYCEPLVQDTIQFEALFNHVKEYGRKAGWRYMELRGGQEFLGTTTPSVAFLGHTLDLTVGADKLFSEFRKGTKSSIKKAERERVTVAISDSLGSVKEFCRLNAITRKHHGLPPQPFRFFEILHRHVISTGSGIVVLASYFDAVIAGAVFVHAGRKVMYKYGASRREHQELRANNLVMWEAMKRYCGDGFESLSFGRTDLENEGLRIFKSGWGTEQRTINYYRHDLRQNAFVSEEPQVNGFSKKIFGKLPVPVLNAIGSLAYRHMG